MRPVDASAFAGLRFAARGEGRFRLMLFSGKGPGRPPFEVPFTAGTGWTTVEVPFAAVPGFDAARLQAVAFCGGTEPGDAMLDVDEVELIAP